MTKIVTKWESTEPNPDEEHIKGLWQAEIKDVERSVAEEEGLSRRRQDNIKPLVKGSGLSQDEIAERQKQGKNQSGKSLKDSEKQLTKPPIDIETLHKQHLELAKANAERKKSPGNPSWWGYIWNAAYGGWWSSWNGETEEVPNVSFNVGANRFDPRAQAWGEGWYDGDFSKIHGYLGFRFNPPSWGHLHIYTYPWLHGYYNLYSDDEWYNSEYARAKLDTWVDVHQNFWRSRQYRRRFTMASGELHPTRYGRFDSSYSHAYYTDVGEGDTVTIRVGTHLDCYARASGGRSKLNFQAGTGNYIHVPYVYWYLHN